MSAQGETAQECAERMGVPLHHDDRPELWAFAKVSWEYAGNGPWEALPYYDSDLRGTDQLLRLVFAKGELDELRRLGFDLVRTER